MENYSNEESWVATYLEQKKLEQQKLEKNSNKKPEPYFFKKEGKEFLIYDEKQKDYNENSEKKLQKNYLKFRIQKNMKI